MKKIKPPRFELKKVYSDGSSDKPEIYRLSEFNGNWNVSRRSFLKAASVGIGILGMGPLIGCGSSGDGGVEDVTNPSEGETDVNPTENAYEFNLHAIAHDSSVEMLALDKDNSILASEDTYGNIKLWNFPSGKHSTSVNIKSSHNRRPSVSFSPDESIVVSASGELIKLWNASTGEIILDINTEKDEVGNVLFSPDGKIIAATLKHGEESFGVDLYEASSGNKLKTLTGHVNPVWAIAFNQQGNILASMSGSIILWSMPSGSELHKLTGHGAYDMDFSPNDNLLATAGGYNNGEESYGRIKIWNPSTGQLIKTLSGHSDRVKTVSFVPNSDLLVSGSNDGTIKIWEVSSGTIIHEIRDYLFVDNIAVSADGSFFISTGGQIEKDNVGTVKLWSLPSGAPIDEINAHLDKILAITLNADASKFVSKSADTTIKVWDISSKKPITKIDLEHYGAPRILGFDSDGMLVTTSFIDRTIKYWEVPEGRLVHTYFTTSELRGRFSLNQDFSLAALTAADLSREIIIWDLINNQELHRLPVNNEYIRAIEFSPNGSLLASASSDDSSITLWDVATGTIKKILTGHNTKPWRLAFNPDGTLLASAGNDVRIWQISTGKLLFDLDTQEINQKENLNFSPDGSLLAFNYLKRRLSGSDIAKHWIELRDVTTGELINTWDSKTKCLTNLIFDQNSNYLISTAQDGNIRLWDIPSGNMITSLFDENALKLGKQVKYFSLENEKGQVFMYTLPCSSSKLPDGAICVCNCVDGISTNEEPRCPGSGSGGGGPCLPHFVWDDQYY